MAIDRIVRAAHMASGAARCVHGPRADGRTGATARRGAGGSRRRRAGCASRVHTGFDAPWPPASAHHIAPDAPPTVNAASYCGKYVSKRSRAEIV
eukprot:6587582-Prymnesium_polylepis.2